MSKGSFTLPGEAGYEKLTLELAEKWGADVIRDSDGTTLSDEILNAGYDIYSTICIIREHNAWAKEHPECRQQTFLQSQPVTAEDPCISIHLLDGYFAEQFVLNDTDEAMKYWQVYDRTAEKEIPSSKWVYEREAGNVVIKQCEAYHSYTVNFLAYRIWEEINMYNHVTNHWNKEHLIPVDPRSKAAQEYLKNWLTDWCKTHEDTNVVRFTSMFYNFVWIWGSDDRNRNLFTDWGSYDFTVSPEALMRFEKEYGYALSSEDFINQGKLHVTHMAPTDRQRDYMRFTNRFVVDYGRELVDLVKSYGKKAYVFYDDSWVGVEPYSELFPEFHFDGLIKCVFSGYEVRLCAGAKADVHEIRLHPYLFPVGLGGKPTFSEDGDPTADAKQYWRSVRRALLRQPVDRIGLGGYLHLVEPYPDFKEYIAELADEFRTIKGFHKNGAPYILPCKVAVLHAWGKLRSWTLSGHFHETYMHDLIHINEALSGLPVDVTFVNFEDAKAGKLTDVDVVINAGRAGSAWSGGDAWKDPELVAALTKWVYEGGIFIGVNEPSAAEGFMDYFRMAQVLGVDEDTGAKVCHGKWNFKTEEIKGLIPDGAEVRAKKDRYVTDGKTKVLLAEDGAPALTIRDVGKGKGIYLSEFGISNANTRMLLNLMLYATDGKMEQQYLTDNYDTECAYYPVDRKLVVVNNSDKTQTAHITVEGGEVVSVDLDAFETKILEL